jgi:hypothetical protein
MKNFKKISKVKLKSINGGGKGGPFNCPPGYFHCPLPWGNEGICLPHENHMACPDL